MAHPDDFGPMSREDWEDFQTCVGNFERAWRENPDTVKISDFLPAFNSSFRHTVLYELVKIDLEHRWNSDKALPLDWYLEHYQELGARDTVSPELVFEEVRNKQKHGVPVKLETYQRNYPQQFARLKQLIEKHFGSAGALSSSSPGRTGGGGRARNAVIPEPGVYAREYELIKKIGEGSFAEVWAARHKDSDKEVAVKYLHRPLSAEESQRELEALKLVKSLEHPHLLDYHIFWEEHGRLWVVMGFARYGTLKTRMRECKRMGLLAIPVDELFGYMEQIADAIDYLHDQGIQHRDIKPENILLFGPRYVKLADFGLAKQMGEKDRTRTIGGTPLYQAPEMFDGDVVNRFSDQYCFAFTYSELRLGESPFQGRSLHTLPLAHKTETPNLTALPPLEQQVMLRALAKEPTARFPTCREFVRQLGAAIAESRTLGLLPATPQVGGGLEARPAAGRSSTGSGSGSASGSGSGSGPGSGPTAAQSLSVQTPPTSGAEADSDPDSRTSTLRIVPGSGPVKTPAKAQDVPESAKPARPQMPSATPVKHGGSPNPAATPARSPATPSRPTAQHPSATPVHQGGKSGGAGTDKPPQDEADTSGTLRLGIPGAPKPPTHHEIHLPESTERVPEGKKPVAPTKPPTHHSIQLPEEPAAESRPVPTQPVGKSSGAPTPTDKPSQDEADPTSTLRIGRPGARPPTLQEFQLPEVPERTAESNKTVDPPKGKVTQKPAKPAPPPKPPKPPAFDFEEYDVGEVIGRGDFGEVRKARHKKTGQEVAVKRLFRSIDDDVTRRELTSLNSLKELHHSSLVQVHEFRVDSSDRAWIVMELADGGSLKDRLQACRKGIPIEELLPYIKQIAAGLDYLNDNGCMHRDVKPANILLSGGDAKLTDYGLARLCGDNEVIRTMGGTPLYKSPEMYSGRVIKHVSDLYCLAMTYAELRRGEHPYAAFASGPRAAITIENAVRFEPPNLSRLPEAEQEVLRRALAKEYQDRFATCTEFVEALEAALGSVKPAAGKPAAGKKAGKSAAPAQTAMADAGVDQDEFNYREAEPGGFGRVAAAVVLLAAIIGGGAWYFSSRPGPSDPPKNGQPVNAFAELETRLGKHLKEKDFVGAVQAARAEKNLKPDQIAKLQGMIVEPLFAELKASKDTYTTLDQLKVPEICDAEYLSNAQSDEIRQMAHDAFVGKVNALLDDLKKKADRDLSANEPLLQSAMALSETYQNKYHHALDLGVATQDRIEFWKKLLEIDQRLYASKADPAKAFDLYLNLVKSRTMFEQSLDRQTDQLLKHPETSKRFKEYEDVFVDKKKDAMKLVAARSALDKILAVQPVEAVADVLKRFMTRYNGADDKLNELRGDLASISTAKKDDEQQIAYDAADALVSYHLASDKDGAFKRLQETMKGKVLEKGPPRLVVEMGDLAAAKPGFTIARENFDLLEKAAEKVFATEKDKAWKARSQEQFSRVINKYIEQRVPTWPDAADEWKHRERVCKKSTEPSFWVKACWVEALLEQNQRAGEEWTAAFKELESALEKLPKDDGLQTYARYVHAHALAETGNPLKAAEVLLAADRNHLKGLHEERMSRAGAALVAAAAPANRAERIGLANLQFATAENAEIVKKHYDLADALLQPKSAELLKIDLQKLKVDLVLARAKTNTPDDRRALPDLIKKIAPELNPSKDDAWYPVKAAHAAALTDNAAKLAVYRELVQELKRHRKEAQPKASLADARLLTKEVLKVVIDEFPETPGAKGSQANKSLAEILAWQAELIPELLRKHGAGGWESKDSKKDVFDYWQRASDLDEGNVDYIFGTAKSKVELDDFDWRERESWLPIGKWAEQAVKAGAEHPKAHWLKGWAKLQEARAVRYGDPTLPELVELAELAKVDKADVAREAAYEKAKLARLAAADKALAAAAPLAEKAKATDAALAVRIYLEQAEAALDMADYYHYIPYDGIRQRLSAADQKKTYLEKAAACVKNAQESLAKLGQQQVPSDILADIHESLGKRIYHLTFHMHLDPAEGFPEALKEFERALALEPERLGPVIGKGRTLYREARFVRNDPDRAAEKDAQAEAEFNKARAGFGDSLRAVEPNYYLGAIAYYRSQRKEDKSERKKELDYYDEALRLYDKHKHAAGYPGPVRQAAMEIAQLATHAAVEPAWATTNNPKLPPHKIYALKMETLDPSQAAEMYRKYGTSSVAALNKQLVGLDAVKQKAERLKLRKVIVEHLDKLIPAGAQQGAVDSELLLVKWRRFEAMTHWDASKNDIYVENEKVRKHLLEQFERNAELAPNDYIRVWSLLFTAEIDYYSEDQAKVLDRYKKGLALAEQLTKLHGTGSIGNDRPFETGKKPTSFDEWDALFIYYQGAARVAKGLALDPARKGKRQENLRYALDCVDKALSGEAGPVAKERPNLVKLRTEIEKEMKK